MKVNTQKLKGRIVECNTTLEAVADTIGINRCTFYRKLKNSGKSFTISEVHKLVEAIPLTRDDAIEIFFGQ